MTAFDRPGDAFQRALDDVGRRQQPETGVGGGPVSAPGLGARFDFGPAPGAGGQARWGLAMDWADEPSPLPSATGSQKFLRPALDSVTGGAIAEAVALELDFGGCLTPDALAERWRTFLWRNHPDRQPAQGRERANARVAVANALYDSARRALRPA
jgi:hypothetical protein